MGINLVKDFAGYGLITGDFQFQTYMALFFKA